MISDRYGKKGMEKFKKLACVANVLIFCLYLYSDAADNSFYFIQITDTHWGEGDNIDRTRKVVESINKLPFDIQFVIHTGDMVTSSALGDSSVVDSGMTLMEKLKWPVHYVAGNHDIPAEKFTRISGEYTRRFGDLGSIKKVKDVSTVTLYDYTATDAKGKVLYDPVKQLKYLMQRKAERTPVILFKHVPIAQDFYNNSFHKSFSDSDRSRFQTVCEENGVIAIITGHFHRNELHWLGDIPQYVAPPVSGSWGRQSSYRIYHYKDGKLSFSTVYL